MPTPHDKSYVVSYVHEFSGPPFIAIFLYDCYSRAYKLWTEEFLISEYGNLTVRLESRAESNDRVPAGEGGVLGRDTVRHFIQNYQQVDAYVISQVPQPMEKDVGIPPCLR